MESGDAPAGERAVPGDGGSPGDLALLEAAVRAVGGQPRPGQQAMAAAVHEAAATGEHLLVQAGTGTGKSLAYLVPAITHAVATGRPAVVSTATLALQAQIVDRDLPRIAAALEPVLGRRITWQLVKGRGNYVCRHKASGGFPADDDVLFDLRTGVVPAATPEPGAGPVGRFGREVARLREWASQTPSGDRDELVPGVSDRAWRQVSVSARECLGGQRCPEAAECFSEQARERAHEVDVVVTNHALVAIDTFEGRRMLPEHDLLVLDEGHEFADRVTSVISDELSEGIVEAASRRVRQAGVSDAGRLDDAGALLAAALAETPEGRLALGLPEELASAAAGLRDAARDALTALKGEGAGQAGKNGGDGAKQAARAAVTELHGVAERLASGAAGPQGPDVAWVSRIRRPDGGTRVALHVAPLSVAGLCASGSTTTAPSCSPRRRWRWAGRSSRPLPPSGCSATTRPPGAASTWAARSTTHGRASSTSPGTCRRRGATACLRPALDELTALVQAAGGRTLGLFSSRRAAEYAAEELRERLDVPVLCQGDDATPTLVREFARDAGTCLFGTLSLWQGVDVPGSACQLVVIDRIPFPRPDDPLASARQQAVARAGGNGFMTVAATHAALRLAQGVGRLVRSAGDRGVVAVLDSRLATARYGAFLRASLPPFWATESREAVLDALRRIDAAAQPPLPVREAAARAASEG